MRDFSALRSNALRYGAYIALLAPALSSWSPAAAQEPGKPIRLLVPFAPGGAQDIIGRYLSAQLAGRLSGPMIIENKSGAGGVIAAEAVARAPADGTTLLLATGGAISIAPHLMAKMSYKPQQDLVPVALVADTPMAIAVRTQSTFKSLPDLLTTATAQPGKLTYASTGTGTVSHLTGELLAQRSKTQLTHIPYRGAAPALIDLISGNVDAIVTSAASLEPMVANGKARVLGTFTKAPLSSLPNTPTVQEATGLLDLSVPVWVGVMAPSKTPPAVVKHLTDEILKVCLQASTKKRLQEAGAEVICAGSQELAQLINEDTQRWAGVIKQGNLKSQ